MMQDLKIHNPAIVLENVDVRLGGLSILNEVNLSIGAGEFIVVWDQMVPVRLLY